MVILYKFSKLFFLVWIFSFNFIFSQNDTLDVINCFYSYKQNFRNGNGIEAWKLLDNQSQSHYDSLWYQIKYGDSISISKMLFFEKMSLIHSRLLLDSTHYQEFNTQSFFHFALQNKIFQNNGIAITTVDSLIFGFNFASGKLVAKDSKPTPAFVHFYKINNSWKINVLPVILETDKAVVDAMKKRKNLEQQYYTAFEKEFNIKLSQNIWVPKILK